MIKNKNRDFGFDMRYMSSLIDDIIGKEIYGSISCMRL